MEWYDYLGISATVIAILGAVVVAIQRIKGFVVGPKPGSLIKRPFTYGNVDAGLAYLCERARSFDPDFLVGINRGGAIIGGMIGKRLNMMIRIFEVTHLEDDKGHSDIKDGLLKGKRVLLVDDRIHKGTNLRKGYQYLVDCGAEVYILVFACPHDWTKHHYPLDYAYKVSSPDLPFPWEPGSSREWK